MTPATRVPTGGESKSRIDPASSSARSRRRTFRQTPALIVAGREAASGKGESPRGNRTEYNVKGQRPHEITPLG